MTNSLFVLRLTLATSNAAEMQSNTHLSVFHVVLRSGTSEDVSVDSNAVLAQENLSLMFKKPYLFIVMYYKILPLASLPQVANKVLLPDHKVDHASKGSWSCNKKSFHISIISENFQESYYTGILLGLTFIIYMRWFFSNSISLLFQYSKIKQLLCRQIFAHGS